MIHFLLADFGHSSNFLRYFKKDKTLHFLFSNERSFMIAMKTFLTLNFLGGGDLRYLYLKTAKKQHKSV